MTEARVDEPQPVLECAGLVRRFGAMVALDGVDFTVGRREIVGLVGPNGSGKTTLLNVIAGSVRPHAGVVRFLGNTITRLAPYQRAQLGIARCTQIVRPLAGMSVREVVMVGALFGTAGSRRRVAAAADRANETLARLGLAAQATRPAVALNIVDRKRLDWRVPWRWTRTTAAR